jgi:subtilase family serine protease
LPDNQGNDDPTSELVAFHQAFLELAAQGISTFASSGDSGAYDANDAVNDPIDNVVSVDAPASDPAITAAGGTTTPMTLAFEDGRHIVIHREQVWGWDYLLKEFGSQVFPVGGGGGVSVFWPRPPYQDGVSGIRTTEPGQKVVYQGQDLLDLPAHYGGRNLPDVSLNADPFSGYLLYSTPDGGLLNGFGGTSFVAPQLNGVTALLGQVAQGRLGLMNPMLYRDQQSSRVLSPLVDIRGGDNWFYSGVAGYEPGAGLGVLDVANLAVAVAREAWFTSTTRH